MNAPSPTAPLHGARRPPTFAEARTPRHKAWAAGFDPAYWYAVAFSPSLAPGGVMRATFQGTEVAVFRGEDGRLAAVEDRCAHRQVRLSDGFVRDCQLVCRYHGWTFASDGRLVAITDDHSGRAVVKAQVRSYPVAEKYGIIFVFFGEPELLPERPLPSIPELDGEDPWFHVPIDYTMRCHPTAYINNVMDSTHVATLHTRFQTRSMIYGPVTRCEAIGDRVELEHRIELDRRGLLRHIVGRLETHTQQAIYDYPYMHVHVGGISSLWNFMLPVDARTTRLFLLSCSKTARVPLLGVRPTGRLARLTVDIAREALVRPLFDEDVWSTEAEQVGYEAHFDQPEIEPHPSIRPCYELTARKWAEHLARVGRAG